MDTTPILNLFAKHPTLAAVVCEFEGSGDSGQINDVLGLTELNPDCIEDYYGKPPCEPAKAELEAMFSVFDDAACHVLERQGVDWYNNDGGFGCVAFFRDGSIRASTNQRYTESNHYGDEFKLKDFVETGNPS